MSKADFFALTPREYFLLREQHRESLMHREMCSAFTTTAVLNTGYRPEKPFVPVDFIPNHRSHVAPTKELTDAQKADVNAFEAAVLARKLALQKEQDGLTRPEGTARRRKRRSSANG